MTGTYVARALRAWFVILFALLFAWTDWLGHHDLLVPVALVVVVVAAVVLGPELVARTGTGSLVRSIPAAARGILLAIPGLVFALVRTPPNQAGPVTASVTVSVLVALAMSVAGAEIDSRLRLYYRVRNLIPRVVRLLAAPVLGILVSFATVHGTANLGLLAGGPRETLPVSPNPVTFALAALVSAVIAVLLLRDAPGPQRTESL